MPIRPEDPRLPYVQLADELRAAIESGRYKEGDQLPSTRQLAEEHGISTGTVQRAMKVLRDQGLVGAHQGRGAFVLASNPPRDPEADPSTPKTLDEALKLLADVQRRLDRLEAQRPAADPAPAVEPTPAQDPAPDSGPEV